MDIIHRFDFEAEDEIEPILDELGIPYEHLSVVNRTITRVRLSESVPQWQALQALARERKIADIWYETWFTDEEVLNAEWLRIRGGFPQIGYPEPQDKWLKESPNYADWCKECGTFRQVGSFTIKKEPRLGKYDFMSLNWTFAIFAVDAVFSALKANGLNGYERWPVHLLNAGQDSDTITQLFIPTIAAPGLVGAKDLNPVRCERCGQLKYNKYHMRGVMQLRRDSIPPDVDFFQTYEWFGEGYQPRRELIVSNRFAQLVYGEKWNKIVFKVVEAV